MGFMRCLWWFYDVFTALITAGLMAGFLLMDMVALLWVYGRFTVGLRWGLWLVDGGFTVGLRWSVGFTVGVWLVDGGLTVG